MASIEKRHTPYGYLSYAVKKQCEDNAGNSDQWGKDNSTIKIYEKSFKDVLGGITIVDFVKERSSPIVIDFMSQRSALVSLFRQMPGHCQLGLSVALSDKEIEKKEVYKAYYKIKHLAGDILSNHTWERINDELGERKADLIMERGNGGLSCISFEGILHAILLRKAWRILSRNGGTLLFETPSIGFDKNLDGWIKYLRENCIDVVYDGGVAMKIIKAPNSPEKLPF